MTKFNYKPVLRLTSDNIKTSNIYLDYMSSDQMFHYNIIIVFLFFLPVDMYLQTV
jgi:hypothetical protein